MVGRSYNHVVCLMAMLVGVGCQETLTPQARQWLQSGYTASSSGNYRGVVQSMDAFLADTAAPSGRTKPTTCEVWPSTTWPTAPELRRT